MSKVLIWRKGGRSTSQQYKKWATGQLHLRGNMLKVVGPIRPNIITLHHIGNHTKAKLLLIRIGSPIMLLLHISIQLEQQSLRTILIKSNNIVLIADFYMSNAYVKGWTILRPFLLKHRLQINNISKQPMVLNNNKKGSTLL